MYVKKRASFLTLLANIQYLILKKEKLTTKKFCFHSRQQQECFALNQTQAKNVGHPLSFTVLQGVLSSVLKNGRHEINY
jgi:hypothetical protein